jgi:hypothetical protein
MDELDKAGNIIEVNLMQVRVSSTCSFRELLTPGVGWWQLIND